MDMALYIPSAAAFWFAGDLFVAAHIRNCVHIHIICEKRGQFSAIGASTLITPPDR